MPGHQRQGRQRQVPERRVQESLLLPRSDCNRWLHTVWCTRPVYLLRQSSWLHAIWHYMCERHCNNSHTNAANNSKGYYCCTLRRDKRKRQMLTKHSCTVMRQFVLSRPTFDIRCATQRLCHMLQALGRRPVRLLRRREAVHRHRQVLPYPRRGCVLQGNPQGRQRQVPERRVQG